MLLDEILKEIGEFGTYQILMYVIVGLAGVPTGWQNMGITFMGAYMDHWCFVPRLENLTYEQQKHIAIPDDPVDTYSHCNMFNINYDELTDDDINNWNRSTVDQVRTIPCPHGWVYDSSVFSSTLVSQFDLVCGKANRLFMVQTIYMCGFLTGCLVFGQLADRIGRHKTLIITLMVEILFATAAAFIPFYAIYVSFRFVVAAAAAGSFTTLFIMSMEMMGPKYRLITGVFIQAWFAVGLMTMPALSYLIRDHIKLQLVCAVSPSLVWMLLFLADESPRWLISNGLDDKATTVLAKIARLNGRKLPQNLNLADNRRRIARKNIGRHYTLLDLLRTRSVRKPLIIMWFIWFSTAMSYYGLGLGVDLLPGSLFVNSFIQAVIEIPSFVFIIFAMQYIGRKLPTFITLLATGICCLLVTPFLNNAGLQGGATAFLMVGKFFVSGTFALIYVYSAELFPTVVREVAVGSSSTCARIGSLLQPQIRLLSRLWHPSAFFVYGILTAVGGIMCVFLPETLGQCLPETMEDGVSFARSAKVNFKRNATPALEPVIEESESQGEDQTMIYVSGSGEKDTDQTTDCRADYSKNLVNGDK